FTAANPTDGRIRSTRQVTSSPTRLAFGSAIKRLHKPVRKSARHWSSQVGPASGTDGRGPIKNELARQAPGEDKSAEQRRAHSHRRGEAVLADIDARGFDIAVRQFGAGGDENLCARFQVAFVAVDELYDHGVVRYHDLFLSVLVFHLEHRAVHR